MVRYISIGGCYDPVAAAVAVRRSVAVLLGPLGSAKVHIEALEPRGTCTLKARFYDASLIDAVILSVALTKVDGEYLRPLAISGTVDGLERERLNHSLSGEARGDDANRPSLSR